MDDHELLEMAAKAVGFEVLPNIEILGEGVWIAEKYRSIFSGERPEYLWNPLMDDGDALRLAMSLDIHVNRYSGATTAKEWTSSLSFTEHDHWSINSNDKMKSTRRSIVRAAAAIGKATL